jgi:hypothetical protein
MANRGVDEGDLDEKQHNACFRVNVVYSKRCKSRQKSLELKYP